MSAGRVFGHGALKNVE